MLPPNLKIKHSVWKFLPCYFSLLGYAVVSLVLIATLLELASWAVWSIHPAGRQVELENEAASPVYAGAEWAREFWEEESLRRRVPKPYVPFRLWSVTNWHGKYINNDLGVRGAWRRTMNPMNCDLRHRVIVWTFGGSTMYGIAVPDWGTVPSYLSRDLNTASGDCIIVDNFGVEGYVSDQELILLAEQLKAGGRPDIVVFYDGVNDSSLAFAPAGAPVPHFSTGTIKARIEGALSGRLDFLQDSYTVRLGQRMLAHFHRPRSLSTRLAEAQRNVGIVMDNYEANMRLANAFADAYKFKLYRFWQPILIYGHKPAVPFEEHLAILAANGTSEESAWFLTMGAVYQEAERRAASSRNFVFLGGLFDSTREPIYVDEAHLGPRGNELAAQAIASYIQDHPEERSSCLRLFDHEVLQH
jgi:lysophospholipase L1-like esterase